MTTPLLPIPQEIYLELLSGLEELDHSYGKTAEAANARQWLKDLAKHWPSLEGVEEGRDMFPDAPIAGECHQ